MSEDLARLIGANLIKSCTLTVGGVACEHYEHCAKCGRLNSYTPKPKDDGDRSVYQCPFCCSLSSDTDPVLQEIWQSLKVDKDCLKKDGYHGLKGTDVTE